LRHREFHWVSGFPLVGSLLLVVSLFCFPSGHPLRLPAVIIALLDTGGIHWFCGGQLYEWLRGRRPKKDRNVP
jgi:hypothetical protein